LIGKLGARRVLRIKKITITKVDIAIIVVNVLLLFGFKRTVELYPNTVRRVVVSNQFAQSMIVLAYLMGVIFTGVLVYAVKKNIGDYLFLRKAESIGRDKLYSMFNSAFSKEERIEKRKIISQLKFKKIISMVIGFFFLINSFCSVYLVISNSSERVSPISIDLMMITGLIMMLMMGCWGFSETVKYDALEARIKNLN